MIREKTRKLKMIAALLAAGSLVLTTGSGLGADAESGKLLFASPALGGGTSGKSCLTCHEHGRDLSPATMVRKEYLVMGNPVATLAGVINFCIEVALRGESIAEDGKEMDALLAYLPIFIKANPAPPQ